MESSKKALVIGVSDYDDITELNDLPFCKKDGVEMLKLLANLGYEIKNKDGLIGRVNGRLMQECIYDFFNVDIKSEDTLLFYFSGHGVPIRGGDFCLSSSDIEHNTPKKNGFSFEDLNEEIANCRSKRIVVILDSCYAGSLSVDAKGSESDMAVAAENQLSKTFKEGEGKILLSSCMGSEESFATVEGDHSFFTNYLLNGLRGANGKSVDEDGIVSPESLMRYIDSEIDKLSTDKRPRQTPFRKIASAGKLVLAIHEEFKETPFDEKLITLLRNGKIEEFNELREKNPSLVLNLTGANLAGAKLDDANLEDAILTNANLEGASLFGTNLNGCKLMNANLNGVRSGEIKLGGADLSNARLKNAELYDAIMPDVNLSDARAEKAKMAGANLYGAKLEGANLTEADLSESILTQARLGFANLTHADLHGATIDMADLTEADLSGAFLDGATLNNSNLSCAILKGVELTRVDTKGASFSGAVFDDQ